MNTSEHSADIAEPPGKRSPSMHNYVSAIQIGNEIGVCPGAVDSRSTIEHIDGERVHTLNGVVKLMGSQVERLDRERIPFTVAVNGSVLISFDEVKDVTPEQLEAMFTVDKRAFLVWKAVNDRILDFDQAMRQARAKKLLQPTQNA